MSLWQLAARNVWQNRGRYISYLSSAIFSVMIYFLYTAIARHPELQSGYRGAGYAVQGMRAASVVIAAFTFLFLLYSNSAFVRSRMKEFGLLSLMGVTKGQLVQIMLFEGVIVAGVALTAGIGLALLFLRLFLMAISTLLQLPEAISFWAGAPVFTETILLFGSFFVFVSLLAMRSIVRQKIIHLIRAARQPKGAPTFSRWKTILGVVLLLGGYAWASIPHPLVIVLGVIPVTAMVSVGTFLLLREGSIAFLTWLHKRERFFYRPGPFLSVSQLVFKMQENYRVLSAGAILMAVILSAVGTVASMYFVVSQDAMGHYPHALQVAKAAGAESTAEVDLVESVLQKHGVGGLAKTELVTVHGDLVTGEDTTQVLLAPYSFYASVQRPEGEQLALTENRDAILVYVVPTAPSMRKTPVVKKRILSVGERQMELQVVTDDTGRILNLDGLSDFTLVLPDEQFEQLVGQVPIAERAQITIWAGETWRSQPVQNALQELKATFPANRRINVTATVEAYQETVATLGLTLFIGVFVSLVFFAAACSLLYFRLFTEIEDDRKYFRRLADLGVSERELKRLALQQSMVVFFVPFLTGLLHSTFAMKALGTIAMRTVLQYGWMVSCGYLVVYALYFAASYTFYWRSLKAGMRYQGALSA